MPRQSSGKSGSTTVCVMTLSMQHYVRVKIFTERGKESQSKIDFPYYGSAKIKDIAARVIKADGTIVVLKKGRHFRSNYRQSQRAESKGEIVRLARH